MITPKSFQLVSIYACALWIPSGRSVLKKYKKVSTRHPHPAPGAAPADSFPSSVIFPSGMKYFFFPPVSGFCDLGPGQIEPFELLKIIIWGSSALSSVGRLGHLEFLL